MLFTNVPIDKKVPSVQKALNVLHEASFNDPIYISNKQDLIDKLNNMDSIEIVTKIVKKSADIFSDIFSTVFEHKYAFYTIEYPISNKYPRICIKELGFNSRKNSIELFILDDENILDDAFLNEKDNELYYVSFSAESADSLFLLQFIVHFFKSNDEYYLHDVIGNILSKDDLLKYFQEKNYKWMYGG